MNHLIPMLMKPRTGFRLDSLFKNPMILLALFSLGMVFIIPRLTASLGSFAFLQGLIIRSGNLG